MGDRQKVVPKQGSHDNSPRPTTSDPPPMGVKVSLDLFGENELMIYAILGH